MSKFFFKRLLIVLYLFCIICPDRIIADLSSDTTYLTWKRQPDTTMTIQWVSTINETKSLVRYKEEGEETWKKEIGTCIPLPNSKDLLIHSVELTNLIPNTLYQFKNGDNPTLKPLFFRTMPKDLSEPIRFVVGGDMYHDGGTTKQMENTCKHAAKTNPHFAMLGGDLAYAFSGPRSHENIGRWIDWIRAWSACMKTDNGRLIPMLAAIGNHDLYGHFDRTPAEAKIFSALFPMPGEQIYNVLDFGSYLSFFILDSGHANPVAGVQEAWLKEALEKRPHSLHRFAIYHVPAYPSIRNFNNRQSAAIRKFWVPIFEKGGIQMAFEHHDHAYKRTIPLIEGKFNAKGIVYIGDGAWSVDKPRSVWFFKRPYLAKFKSSRNFILMTIDQTKRKMMSIDDSGMIIDEYMSYLSENNPVPVAEINGG